MFPCLTALTDKHTELDQYPTSHGAAKQWAHRLTCLHSGPVSMKYQHLNNGQEMDDQPVSNQTILPSTLITCPLMSLALTW
jgi:hypothetical protein